jgi:arylsulfatase A-like enzyme
LVDSVELGDSVNDLALDGGVVYAATSHDQKELIAFDVSQPDAVSELRSVDLPGSANARGVDVHLGLIYVVRRTSRENFHIFDTRGLDEISKARLDGRGEKVRIYRDRAYVATRGVDGGLQIVDVGDSSQPRVIGRVGAAGTNVHVDPPHTYLTSRKRTEGLLVVDTESLLRPNVIVVYTDDQHVSSVDFMPEIEELASRGITFRQSFVTTAVCGPSRASLLTGLYSHNHGAILNVDYIGAAQGAIGSDDSTLATWLQSAGYRTGFFGKYINGFSHKCVDGVCEVPPGWDDWQAKAAGGQGAMYYNYSLSNNGTLESFGNRPEDYSTDVLTRKAVAFLERRDTRPFFALLSVNTPHIDFLGLPPAPRHIGAFAGIPPWRPPSYDEADLSDKPSLFADRPRAADELDSSWTNGEWTDSLRQQQLEALLSVDEAVGEIVATLERMGEHEDTVIIFTSDNGFNWGEHRQWGGKVFPHEESIRVPLAVSYPRLIAPGSEIETSMVLNIDLAPTIAELANTIPGGPVDGRSLVPFLKGESAPRWRNDFLIEHYGSFNPIESAVFQGIRHTSGKYVYYLNTDEDELYDYLRDIFEMESLASPSGYDSVRRAFRGRINQLVTNPAMRSNF